MTQYGMQNSPNLRCVAVGQAISLNTELSLCFQIVAAANKVNVLNAGSVTGKTLMCTLTHNITPAAR